MAIKLSFDTAGNVEMPTLLLATRDGEIIGELSNITDIHLKDTFIGAPEMSFTITKNNNGQLTPYWDDVKDFKLVYCKEWDTWFELLMDKTLSTRTVKTVTLTGLGQAELSHIFVYGLEINTENDIIRDNYTQPTLFYDQDNHTASFLHRILEKAPHYTITHVDEHLKGIRLIFSANDKSIMDCFKEVAEEKDILFSYNFKKINGKLNREVSVYDLKNYCNSCGARGTFLNTCLNCGSTNITKGYGEDTGICVTNEDIGEDITISVNHDNVKNCIRLEGGDDLMTATIRNCNPNGTSYIWNISDMTKEDMKNDLVTLLDSYMKDYSYYKNEYISSLSPSLVDSYNSLVEKYNQTSKDLNATQIKIIKGYSKILEHYYDAVDVGLYLDSGLLPNTQLQDTSASIEAGKITSTALSPVAIIDRRHLTLSNASIAVLNAAKVAADPRYHIAVKESNLVNNTWSGVLSVTNYSDESDTYDTDVIDIVVNFDYEQYIKQKLKKTLYNSMRGKYGSISQMIDMSINDFKQELTKYNLTSLSSFNTCFTECLNLLTEQGIDAQSNSLYSSLYLPIYRKVNIIQSEIKIRDCEIAVINSVKDELLKLKSHINDCLNMEPYLGEDKWLELCAYRRDYTYSNQNYISDYLTNKELFERANEFIDYAEYELVKSSNYTHTITSKIKNFLNIEKFKPIAYYFSCGNWIRIKDDNDNLYKLRLMDYEINFEDFKNFNVSFSDAYRTIDGFAPVKEILMKSSDIINNYKYALNKTNSNFEYISDNMTDVIKNSKVNSDYTYDTSYDLKDDLDQESSKILTEVEDAKSQLSSRIEQTASSIELEVKNGDTSAGIILTIKRENGETAKVSGVIEMTGLVKFSDLASGTETIINGGVIETKSIGADKIKVDELQVGKNISFAPGAKISWNNLPNSVASLTDIPDDEYITTITKDTVTSSYIKSLNLEVGNEITLGAGAKISWNNVTEQPDILDQSQVTTITEDTIKTTNVVAQNLTVNAANITGTLSANKIHGGTIDANNVTIINLNADNITSGKISTELLDVQSIVSQGCSELTYLEVSHIAGNSCNFGGGIIGNVNFNMASWQDVTINGTEYRVLVLD